ncbi:hypothetical protein WJX81_000268 [Elliptochloris bilobata]|uniref:Uncharacterized protein n=1 Tax=Elliptochloris bilobata TaxID=381761 RepID=A0AAW1QMA0_9CHLO
MGRGNSSHIGVVALEEAEAQPAPYQQPQPGFDWLSETSGIVPAERMGAQLESLVAAGGGLVEGSVQRVTFRSDDTGYSVLQVKVAHATGMPPTAAAAQPAKLSGRPRRSSAPKHGMVTVVGALPHAAVGQMLRFAGAWHSHDKFGVQLVAARCEEIAPRSHEALSAYLAGSALPGVGPVMAARLVQRYGDSILEVLDGKGAEAALARVSGIGAVQANRIKAAWDATRGSRDARAFLESHGISGRLATRLAMRFGGDTEAVMRQDPYWALGDESGGGWRLAEGLATALGTPTDLPSRGALALRYTLQLAATKSGHCYLPWGTLAAQTERLMASTGRPWHSRGDLVAVAKRLAELGRLVLEAPRGPLAIAPLPPLSALPPAAIARSIGIDMEKAGTQLLQLPEAGSPSDGAAQAEWTASLEAYLARRIPGVGVKRAHLLVKDLGLKLPALLDKKDAVDRLLKKKVFSIGPKRAADIKAGWDANPRGCLPWVKPSHQAALPPVTALAPAPAPALEPAPAVTPAAAEALEFPALAPLALARAVASLCALPEALAAAADWPPDVRCYAGELHGAEARVAAGLTRLAAQASRPPDAHEERVRRWLARNEKETGVRLSDGQRTAVAQASVAPVMVLTGGPGCGKTFTTRTIVKLWRAMGKRVCMAAPTGRAAQRLQETVSTKGARATTVHRLLGYLPRGALSSAATSANSPSANGGSDASEGASSSLLPGPFTFCDGNPLEADAVLVDEASMLDLGLGAALLDALPRSHPCQLVLVGDADQLPPVGPGSVLAAAIAAGAVPVVDLRDIFRQARQSAIVTSAHDIHCGRFPSLALAPSPPRQPLNGSHAASPQQLGAYGSAAVVSAASGGSDALWVAVEEGAGAEAAVEDGVVEAVRRLLPSLSIDVKADLQVLTPMRKGAAGVAQLNARLQALLIPPAPGHAELPIGGGAGNGAVLRVGDRVIQATNNYDKDVFNGDAGFVVEVDAKARRVVVEFAPLARGEEMRRIQYSGAGLWELELAWATTVHKAQGSEARAVVLALAPSHRPLLTRRLLYTALTRAQELVVVVSPASAIRAALSEAASDARLSSLAPRLRAAADALGLPRHEPQRFEAIVIDAAGSSGPASKDAVAHAEPAPAGLVHESSLRRTAAALSSSEAYDRGSQSAAPRAWERQTFSAGPARGHLQAGEGLGSRGREHSRWGAPHGQRAPVPV